MSITAQQIIDRAATLLLDPTHVRWTVPEMLDWINDARREIAVHRPDVFAVLELHTLVAGSKQMIPVDGTRFLDVPYNIDADNAPGRAIRIIEREMLDAIRPGWHRDKPSTAIRHFAFDERTPRLFHVWPPAVSGHRIGLSYSRRPEYLDADDLGKELHEEDLFAGAIVDFVCYRAHLKDADHAGSMQRASAHYAQFGAVLGMDAKVTAVTTPNTFNQGGTPPRATA